MGGDKLNKLPCAGVIVIDPTETSVVLVETKKGNLSFPKGKRDKGEDIFTTALRELEEETGIRKDMMEDIDASYWIDEMSKKGNPNIRYFIGRLKDEYIEHKFTFDPDELAVVTWYQFDKAFESEWLRDSRKTVLKTALEHEGLG